MIKVEKLNRILRIEESECEQYLANGYTLCSKLIPETPIIETPIIETQQEDIEMLKVKTTKKPLN